jgi:hypothetical protein
MAILAKMFLAIGLIIMIAGLLYPGADAPWISFQNTLQNIQWPTYNNPFSAQIVVSQLLPKDSFCYINPGAIGGCNGNTTAPVGCTFVNAQQCIQTDDEDSSYVVISGDTGNAGFQVNGSQDTFADYSIQAVNFGVWCRSANQTMNLFIHFSTTTLAANFYGTCPISNGVYVKLNGAYPHQIISSPFGANYTMFVERNGTQPGGIARVTMIDLEIIYVPEQVVCAGNVFENTGCQIANFGRTVAKFVAAGINAVSFIISIIAWTAYLVASFFLAVFQTLIFLYAIPGAPPIVQGVVSTIVTGILGATIYLLIKVLRGIP